MRIFFSLIIALCCLAKPSSVIAQEKIFAFLSQNGNFTMRVTGEDFYFQLSQSGKVIDLGTFTSGYISYDSYGRVDKIGSAYISYNSCDRIDKVGSTYLSYNSRGGVDKIGSTYLSYNSYGKMDKIGSIYISYNSNGKIDKIGSGYISHNDFGKVDKISENDGLVIFRNTLNAEDN